MQKIWSLNIIEFCHLIKVLLYIIQYILQKYSKMCAHFYCGQTSDNFFWTPCDLNYMYNLQNLECQTQTCVCVFNFECDIKGSA